MLNAQQVIKYLMFDELSNFEKFTTWHYDLEVNLAGLEVIHHLLHQIEKLQQEKRQLDL